MARVRLFANLRKLAGTSRLEVSGETVGDVVDALVAQYGPDFARSLETSRIWKNGDQTDPSAQVVESDELALIPPVFAIPLVGQALEHGDGAIAFGVMGAFVVVAVGACLLAGWAPLGFSMLTVFLFAGPHNWMEARYFMSRMPARWGRLTRYFSLGIAGVVVLVASFIGGWGMHD